MNSTVVDQIRELLERQDGISSEAMSPLAQAYSAEVSQVNDRLTACIALLRKGLRSEAIQQANLRPNLIDWCAQLDFPEVEEWCEILQFLQVPVPRALNRDAVRQLQDSLIEEQPLEEVLRQHRRLAIAKAPLAWRLKVLRRIAAIDSTNTVWGQDIETWEKARLGELTNEVDAAVKEGSHGHCMALTKELSARDWRIQPPVELVKTVQNAANRLEYARQSKLLAAIAGKLNDAFCSHDQPACRIERDAFQSLTAEMKAPPSLEIKELAEPALLWLEQIDSELLAYEGHLQAVADLEAALEGKSNILSINRTYAAATRSGEELEPSLERRYRAVLGELQLRARRGMVLRVVGVVAATLLAAIAFGAWQWRSLRDRDVHASVLALQTMLDEGKLSEAQQYLDGLKTSKPAIAASTQLVAIESDLSGLQATEAERLTNFESYIEQADNESPRMIDLSTLLKAEGIAKGENEKAQVQRIRRRRAEYDRSTESEQFTVLKGEVEKLTRQLDHLEARNLSELSDNAFDKPLQDIEALRTTYSQAGSNGFKLIDVLQARATSLRSAMREASSTDLKVTSATNQVRQARSLEALHQALESFAASAPNSPMGSDFAAAAKEHEIWLKVTQWNEFTDDLASYLADKTAERAADMLAKLDAIEHAFASNPILAHYPGMRKQFEAMRDRPSILDGLQSSLSNDIRSKLVTLIAAPSKNGELMRFYSYHQYIDGQRLNISQSTSIGLETVTAGDGTVERTALFGKVQIQENPKQIFDDLTARLRVGRKEVLETWEKVLLNSIASTLKHPDLDHRIKEVLIARILRAAVDGSPFLATGLEQSLELLDLRVSRQTNWFIPAIPKSELDGELSHLAGEFSLSYRSLSHVDDSLKMLANSKLDWVGTIQRDQANETIAWLWKTPAQDGRLYIVRGGTVAPALVRVGQVVARQSTLDKPSSDLLLGRPLFFLRD